MGLRFDWYHKVDESFIAVLVAELLDHIALPTAGLSQAKIEQRDQDYRDLAHQMLSAFYREAATLSHEPTAVAQYP